MTKITDFSGWSGDDKAIFQTQRLSVCKFSQENLSQLHKLGLDPVIARMFVSLPYPWSLEMMQVWVESSEYSGQPGYRAGVFLPGGQLIGFCGLSNAPAILSFAFSPEYWGQGYATEIAKGVLTHAFDTFDLPEILAGHFFDNPASGGVLGKLGFTLSQKGQAQSPARVEPAPNLIYRLSKQMFEARNEVS